jgi:parallel beta-helix repeat protein
VDKTTGNGTTTTILVADANLYAVNDVIEYDDDGTVRTVTDVNTTTDIVTFANDALDANSTAGVHIHNWGLAVTDVNEDFHIAPNSPCINAGDPNADPNYVGELDIDGEPRVRGAYVDMGADEVPGVWYVDCDANGADDGSSWEDAFTSIQSGIDAVSNEEIETVLVAEGTYYEAVDFNGKALILRSTDPQDSNVVVATIIDANDPNTDAVTFDSGEDAGSILSGLTVTGGCAGIWLDNEACPTIKNCRIIDNNSYGVNCDSGSPLITNCVVARNSGGGVSGGSPSIVSCSIVYNDGYGIYNSSGATTNCVIWKNTSSVYGCSATYSCVEDSNSGQGNISYHPYFADTDSNDFHLSSYSPCIDSGYPNSDYSSEPNDPNNTCINMGAYGNTPEAALASSDSDSDSLPDTWELLYWPSVDTNDANGDPDDDDVNNLEEYHSGTDPNSSDTDGDGMPDDWERDNGFDPLDDSDGALDPDEDDLTNAQEYNAGTNPNSADTDADGMPDGWEVDNSLNPLVDDADDDLDSDGYSNIIEYLHDGDPNDPNAALSTIKLTVPTDVNTIQQAIDWSIDGDTIEVYPGTYYESIDVNNKAVTLMSSDPNDWYVVGVTIINANDTNIAVVTFDDGEDANCVLTGLTITGGDYGVYCSNSSSPAVSRCIIEDNNSRGVYCSSGSPLITNNMICANGDDGIYSSSSSPPTVKNNWLYDNENGIGFASAASAGTVRNNTVVYHDGDGIYVDSGTAPAISNCILWTNGDDLYNCAATYSCIQDGDAGTGNISSNPNFIDDPNVDCRLQRTSPCKGAGDPNGTYSGETDIENEVRDANGVDMGADEICEVHNTTQDIWYDNIQEAIDDANGYDHDVVVLYEWTFEESINFSGKAITLRSTEPNNWTVVECTIIDAGDEDANVVTFDSGEDSNTVLRGFTITGGKNGVFCDNSSSPVMRKCIVTDNDSIGILCQSGSPLIVNNKIGQNNGDGVYSASAAVPAIKYNWIYENVTGIKFAGATSAALVLNNTVADNQSAGIHKASGTDPNISSCIVWGHDSNDLISCEAKYSCIEDPNDANGVGNFSNDPLFINRSGHNLHLKLISPALSSGDKGIDRAGDFDIDSQRVSKTLEVDVASPGNGSSWQAAYKYLQPLIEDITADPPHVTKPDSILVARGTYYPDRQSGGSRTMQRASAFPLIEDVRIYGGFAGNEDPLSSSFDLDQRDYQSNETTLTGDLGGDDGDNFTNRSDNCYHIVTGVGGATLDGFTIEGGYADGAGELSFGGGMYSYMCAPTVANCTFRDNHADIDGGGLNNYGAWSDTILRKCLFEDNRADGYGGAVMNFYAKCDTDRCFFMNNTALCGGAIFNRGASNNSPITNSVFSGNEATQATGGGGAICDYFVTDPWVVNCTFNDNTAVYGKAVLCYLAYGRYRNCIMWGDTGGQFYNASGVPSVQYSDVRGGYSGLGNIDSDPKFFAAGDLDGDDQTLATIDDGLGLKHTSPCIDTGNNTSASGLETDIAGIDRILDGDGSGAPAAVVDMGAYEVFRLSASAIRFHTTSAYNDIGTDSGSGLTDCQVHFGRRNGTGSYAYTDLYIEIDASGGSAGAIDEAHLFITSQSDSDGIRVGFRETGASTNTYRIFSPIHLATASSQSTLELKVVDEETLSVAGVAGRKVDRGEVAAITAPIGPITVT